MRIQAIELPTVHTGEVMQSPYLLVISEMEAANRLTPEKIAAMKAALEGCAGMIVTDEPAYLGETPIELSYKARHVTATDAMGEFLAKDPTPPGDLLQQALTANQEAHEMDQAEIRRLRMILEDKDVQLQNERRKNAVLSDQLQTARAEKRTYEDANRNCGEIINGLQDDLHRLSTRRGQATAETMGKAVNDLHSSVDWAARTTRDRARYIERGRRLADILGIEVTD